MTPQTKKIADSLLCNVRSYVDMSTSVLFTKQAALSARVEKLIAQQERVERATLELLTELRRVTEALGER